MSRFGPPGTTRPAWSRTIGLAFWVPVVALALLSVSVTGYASADGPVSVTDFRGKVLRFAQRPRRILCLIESAVSGFYMLGTGERLVGVPRNLYDEPLFTRYAGLDPRIAARALPSPGSWDFVSLEGVMALRPDLVVIWSHQTESIAALESHGIPVFGVFITSIADVEREMNALGALTGTESRAAELIAASRTRTQAIQERVASIPPAGRPTVYFMWSQGQLDTSCGGSTVDALIALSGGRNVCAGIAAEHATLHLEQLIAWDPQVILMWPNPRLTPAQLRADPQWQRLSAVRSGRVHQLPEVFLCDLWTLKYQYAATLVAAWLHPDRFADLAPEEEAERLLDHLYPAVR